MHIEEDTIGSDYAILRLRGEFDTPFVPEFEQEIENRANSGKLRIILNLRFLRLINSTALGALVRTQKKLRQRGGDLVISQPSAFCKDVIGKLHLDRLIKIYEDDALAIDADSETKRATATVQTAGDVLFSYTDPQKAKFAPRPTEIGRIRTLEEEAIVFAWNAKDTNLQVNDLRMLFEPGTELRLKFKLPMAKKLDFIEVLSKIVSLDFPKEGFGVGVRARITQMSDADKKSLQQFVQDMRFLKDELKKATEQ
ncbi:MAG: STAS domain-containing protein [Planctomycetes bacterium]|nr:STAS domain-containing protein [Planctomycetota bacterium]